jgi:hypothetical protein
VKKRGAILFVSIATISSCAAGDSERLVMPAVVAAEASIGFARSDGVDLSAYSLSSINMMAFGEQKVVAQSVTSPHIERVRAALRDKIYWEACYSILSPEVVSATYCYYLEKSTLKLLTVYRTK